MPHGPDPPTSLVSFLENGFLCGSQYVVVSHEALALYILNGMVESQLIMVKEGFASSMNIVS